MNLPKIHSITKKILVALLGAFLVIFLLFHACANLCILRHDDGAWYSAFCHFMGTNLLVKIFEVILLGTFLLHICITLWLWLTNKMARPVAYHHASRTKTHKGSKLQVWTGVLIFALLIVHFCDFYFVKLGWVEGKYMVKTEKLMSDEVAAMQQAAAQYGMTPEDFVNANEEQLKMYADQIPAEQMEQISAQLEKMRESIPAANLLAKAEQEGLFSADRKWIKGIDAETEEQLSQAGFEVEPDFYLMTREKFHNPVMAILYLIFFAIVWFHLRHAFAALFQTFGLYNYKYGPAIEVIASIYAWFVVLCFAAVVLLVFIGL